MLLKMSSNIKRCCVQPIANICDIAGPAYDYVGTSNIETIPCINSQQSPPRKNAVRTLLEQVGVTVIVAGGLTDPKKESNENEKPGNPAKSPTHSSFEEFGADIK
ncbi:hypothetical protein HUJ05_002173 [Dendroctonus ponderosae]|nr:hypothetical protein HUJ05_002173 [Dendroctonus ponderosae]